MRIQSILGWPADSMVDMAAFKFRGNASDWWETWLLGRPMGAPPVTWNNFNEAFLERFVPETIHMAKEQEIEKLQQGPDMSINEYNAKFVCMAHYAPHVVPDERRRIRQFILGLRQPFYDVVSPQVNVYPSYAATIEAVRMVEYRQKTKSHNMKKKGREHEGRCSGWVDRGI